MGATASNKRVSFGRDLLIAVVVLGGLSLIVSGGTVFSYAAILAASGLRNGYLAWLGSGLLFDLVVAFFLFLEALVFAAFLHLGRRAFGAFN